MNSSRFDVVVIGGGHAGAEAAWAAANLGASCALVTMDPAKIGTMSCNPAIGGLAKGQIVREIDALGGLMGLAADATGIQFRMLNASKGPAVQGPRAQCDKYRYAREVQRLLGCRKEIAIVQGTVERVLVDRGRVIGVEVRDAKNGTGHLMASAVVLTTGTFMRGLMHTGERQSEGGRVGEGSAVGISGGLKELGFELGRLKTGTPPRLAAETVDFGNLELQPGDRIPVPFSDMSGAVGGSGGIYGQVGGRFPVQEQRPCHLTHTCEESHQLIRENLHRAPMYNGQIQTTGPRYCPSIEDKVVRFADRASHHVYLEPESLDTNEVYCNGISTSLPADVQEFIVHRMPGCERAKVLRYGYAVEYDMVWPHQIDATGMTKRVAGLFLAGQINGTSGYEEAAGQGLVAGLNAVRFVRGEPPVTLRRDQAYIGVMMDDLVTKTPREPYRMFTSRAEFRLLLRGDNTDERLTPLGREWGLVDDLRWRVFQDRTATLEAVRAAMEGARVDGVQMIEWARRPEATAEGVLARLNGATPVDGRLVTRILTDLQYAGYILRQQREIERLAGEELTPLSADLDYAAIMGLRREARTVLSKFRPTTLGQAGRLAGVTPADLMVLCVSMGR